MKVISLGMGTKIFEQDSAVRQRMAGYGQIFDELHLIVFTPNLEIYSDQNIAPNVFLYPTKSKIRIFYSLDFIRIASRIIKRVGKKDFLVSTQDPFETGIVGLLIKFFYRLPLQVQIHTDFINKHFITHSLMNLIRLPLGIFVVSFADSVRCVSERIAQSIRSVANNVSVLPILIETGQFTETKKPKNSDIINILTVSRLEKEKDLTTAIEAFAKLVVHTDAVYTIVGDGTERAKLENLCRDLKIEDRVVFVGWQNNLTKFYEEADIYLSTSLYEGYGMSVVEAGLAGLGLVLSDAGVANSVFKNEESAIICRPRDVAGFFNALSKLAKENDLRQRMGLSAQNEAKKHLVQRGEYLHGYGDSFVRAKDFYREGGIFKKNILLRYVVAGLTGAGTQIGLLYIFTDLLNVWYIYSSVIAFVSAIVVSFLLQKFWTFKDKATDNIHHQAFKYLITAVSGLLINTVLMYVLVDLFGLWYILAQIIIGAVIMVFNFLMYKLFVFHKK